MRDLLRSGRGLGAAFLEKRSIHAHFADAEKSAASTCRLTNDGWRTGVVWRSASLVVVP